jgi:hypothetical protein
MCYLVRQAGGWSIMVADKRSAGNATDYTQIATTIAAIFTSGVVH